MKSKRAEKYLDRKSPVKTVGDSKFYYPINRLEAEKAVELAEQDAEEKIEALKARAVEAYRTHCRRYTNPCIWTTRNKCPDTCAYLQDFIQKLNER